MHPNEALMREKELLADEAGIDVVDFDELKLDVDWGDMTPEPFASGGGVGSLFKETNRTRYVAGKEVGQQVAKYAGKKVIAGLEWLLKQLKGKGKKEDLYEMIDMEKLMKGKDKIKLYSGSVERPSNIWKSFVEDAKMFDTTPEKIAKDKFKDQWFTGWRSKSSGTSADSGTGWMASWAGGWNGPAPTPRNFRRALIPPCWTCRMGYPTFRPSSSRPWPGCPRRRSPR